MTTSLPGEGGSFTGNTLLETTITHDHVGVVVEQVKARLVEGGRHVGLCDGETNSIGESLTERPLSIEDVGRILAPWTGQMATQTSEVIDGAK